MRGRRFWASASVVVLVLEGCGHGPGDPRPVAERFLRRLDAGDGPAACRLLSERYREDWDRRVASGCRSAILDIAVPRAARIVSTRVADRTAVVTVRARTEGARIRLDVSNGEWRITGARAV